MRLIIQFRIWLAAPNLKDLLPNIEGPPLPLIEILPLPLHLPHRLHKHILGIRIERSRPPRKIPIPSHTNPRQPIRHHPKCLVNHIVVLVDDGHFDGVEDARDGHAEMGVVGEQSTTVGGVVPADDPGVGTGGRVGELGGGEGGQGEVEFTPVLTNDSFELAFGVLFEQAELLELVVFYDCDLLEEVVAAGWDELHSQIHTHSLFQPLPGNLKHPVEFKSKRKHSHHCVAVGSGEGLPLRPKNVEVEGPDLEAVGVVVDALDIGLKIFAGFIVHEFVVGLANPVQINVAQVSIQWESYIPEHLAHSSFQEHPLFVEGEEAVLCGGPAHPVEQVLAVVSDHSGNTLLISKDVQPPFQRLFAELGSASPRLQQRQQQNHPDGSDHHCFQHFHYIVDLST